MASWEVETDLIIHCRVKIVVDADSKDDAIETAVDLMPSYGGDAKWRAKVDLKAPAGIKIRVAKA